MGDLALFLAESILLYGVNLNFEKGPPPQLPEDQYFLLPLRFANVVSCSCELWRSLPCALDILFLLQIHQ